jgi:hypothetical protein
MEEGYLLFDWTDEQAFFFPERTFHETFTLPEDLKKAAHVGFKPDFPNRHRIDSFLCNHAFYHAKSMWWPESQFLVLGTYHLDVTQFMKLGR